MRGDATVVDTLIVLFFFLGISGLSGITLVFVTKNLTILMIGILSAFAAIGYSLGPKPYLNLPIVLYSVIPMIMTVFLMSTNNTSDIEKDRGHRVTLPHVIGFRNSIKLIIPEALLMLIAWTTLYLIGGITLLMFISGVVIFYYFGYIRWYKDYYQIQAPYKEMGREFGPRPLLLIYSFNLILSTEFFIYLIQS